MNKNILTSYATALLVGGTLLLSSCSKDEVAPVITLKGDAVQTVVLNAPLVDPMATANDEKDGDVSANITSDYLDVVKKDLVGTYTVTYKVLDEKSNEGTETRTVKVKNDAFAWEGSYSYADECNGVVGGPYTGAVTITASTTTNNKITFNKFAYYTNAKIDATASGSSLIIATQTVSGIGTANESHTFSAASGTVTGTGATGSKITVNFNDANNTGGGNVSCVSTYTKQ